MELHQKPGFTSFEGRVIAGVPSDVLAVDKVEAVADSSALL